MARVLTLLLLNAISASFVHASCESILGDDVDASVGRIACMLETMGDDDLKEVMGFDGDVGLAIRTVMEQKVATHWDGKNVGDAYLDLGSPHFVKELPNGYIASYYWYDIQEEDNEPPCALRITASDAAGAILQVSTSLYEENCSAFLLQMYRRFVAPAPIGTVSPVGGRDSSASMRHQTESFKDWYMSANPRTAEIVAGTAEQDDEGIHFAIVYLPLSDGSCEYPSSPVIRMSEELVQRFLSTRKKEGSNLVMGGLLTKGYAEARFDGLLPMRWKWILTSFGDNGLILFESESEDPLTQSLFLVSLPSFLRRGQGLRLVLRADDDESVIFTPIIMRFSLVGSSDAIDKSMEVCQSLTDSGSEEESSNEVFEFLRSLE